MKVRDLQLSEEKRREIRYAVYDTVNEESGLLCIKEMDDGLALKIITNDEETP